MDVTDDLPRPYTIEKSEYAELIFAGRRYWSVTILLHMLPKEFRIGDDTFANAEWIF